uniref:Putative methyltransferase n=1 Tax=viral metagenome TaxID=1070528 RepID=A0A6H1ZER6_9ZZZZ
MNQKNYWERENLIKRRLPEHPCIREYVVPKIKEIQKIIQINKENTFLDVGCGNGFFGYYFEKICRTTGVDYSEKMIELNPIKNKHIMDANNLKFKDNSFDIVFCHALLHHIEDIDRVIQEMRRVSKKYIVILEPNRNNPLMFLFSLIIKEERKALNFSLAYLKKIVSKNLKIIDAFSYGMIVPNKTPKIFLPIVKLFNFKQPFGMTNFVITQK